MAAIISIFLGQAYLSDYGYPSAVTIRPAPRARLVTAAMLATIGLLLVAIVASYALGSKWIAPDEVVRALLGGADATSEGIVGGLRASRTALGLLCGAALGAAGVLMQALTRDPVADPGL